MPVSTDESTPVAKTFPTDLTGADVMLTKDDVAAALNTGIKLLDVHDIDEWTGESSSPYGKDFAPRKGHTVMQGMYRSLSYVGAMMCAACTGSSPGIRL